MLHNLPHTISGAELVGQFVGPYRLVRLIGEGGMGLVFEAVHGSLGGRAAIKLLRPEFAGRPDVTARFFNEARAANAVRHPGIVRIFDCGFTANHMGFLAMEFLSGESLRSRLDRTHQLSVAESLHIGRQAAAALHAAHSQRVIHRDLKPDNLMLVPDPELASGERVKVLDFGIAKIAEELSAQSVRTQSNVLMGTPLYMPPEQCRGARYVTEKSDVYSLGVILFQMLAGRTPFIGEGIGELAAMHLVDAPPELSDLAPHVDPALARLVRIMLAKQGAARPTMDEVLETIQGMRRPAGGAWAQPASIRRAGAEEPTHPISLRTIGDLLPSTERAIGDEPTQALAELRLPPTRPASIVAPGAGPAPTVGEVASEVQRPVASQARVRASIGLCLLAGVALVSAALYVRKGGREVADERARSAVAVAPSRPSAREAAVSAVSRAVPPTATAEQPPASPAEPLKKGQEQDKALIRAQAALHAGDHAEALYWSGRCSAVNKLRCALIMALASCKSKEAKDSPQHIERINTALHTLDAAGKEEQVAAVHTVCAEHGLRIGSQGRYALPLALRPFPSIPELRPDASERADSAALGSKCVNQATQHLANREYTRALRMAEICVGGLGGSVRRSWTIISYAACMLGEKDKAVDAFARIRAMRAEPSTEALMLRLCKSRGITLPASS